MEEIIVEWQVLAFVVPWLLGWELGVYFFYQFWKNRSAKLRMNRILLSYGCAIILIVNGALFMLINSLFFDNADDIISKIGLLAILLAPIAFMAFIMNNDSKRFIKLSLARIITIASVIPIIVLFFVGMQNPLFMLSVFINVLNVYFAFAYLVRIIRVSMGNIHRRMLEIFIGDIFGLSSFFFAAQVAFSFFEGSQLVPLFIAITLLTIAFAIMFWAVNDFPPFYEFDWKENLLKLFIIDQKHKQFLYVRDFSCWTDGTKTASTTKREQLRDDLFTGAIDGIETMISTITSSTNQKLYEIDQGDSMILVEYGDESRSPIIYALVVKIGLSSLRHLLKNIKTQFESSFSEILNELDQLDEQGQMNHFFQKFDIILNSIMSS